MIIYTPDGGSLSEGQLKEGPRVWLKAAWGTVGIIPPEFVMFHPKSYELGDWIAGSTLWAQHSYEPRIRDGGEWEVPPGATPITVIIYDHPNGSWCMLWCTPQGQEAWMLGLISSLPGNPVPGEETPWSYLPGASRGA